MTEAQKTLFTQLNFRDLGGLEATGGLRLRHGLLFRSEAPGRFTTEQQSALAATGLRLVCDLRSDRETTHAPYDWGSSVSVIKLNLPDDFGDAGGLGRQILCAQPDEIGARAAMQASYATMPAALRPHLLNIVSAILIGGVPTLFHCTAGKDRTGVLVALILLFIGVPLELTVQDYLRSASFGERLRSTGNMVAAFSQMYGFALDQPTVDAVIGVNQDYLMAALDQLVTDWGSIDRYFNSVGIDATCRDELLSKLTQIH
jgi:protein-tyrosine phosphatase